MDYTFERKRKDFDEGPNQQSMVIFNSQSALFHIICVTYKVLFWRFALLLKCCSCSSFHLTKWSVSIFDLLINRCILDAYFATWIFPAAATHFSTEKLFSYTFFCVWRAKKIIVVFVLKHTKIWPIHHDRDAICYLLLVIQLFYILFGTLVKKHLTVSLHTVNERVKISVDVLQICT